jgi:glycosyltransferase involved in cell wall biosynthesis
MNVAFLFGAAGWQTSIGGSVISRRYMMKRLEAQGHNVVGLTPTDHWPVGLDVVVYGFGLPVPVFTPPGKERVIFYAAQPIPNDPEAVKRADKVIVPSQATASLLYTPKSKPKRVQVVPPSYEPKQQALNGSPSSVLYVKPIPHKGVFLFNRIAVYMPTTQFNVVASEKKWLTPRPNVKVVSTPTDMPTQYADAAVLVVPSMCDDCYPRVILEAQAYGVPVVGRTVGGIPEAIGDGGVCVSCSDDPDEWSAAIHSIIDARMRYSGLAYANFVRADAAAKEACLHLLDFE